MANVSKGKVGLLACGLLIGVALGFWWSAGQSGRQAAAEPVTEPLAQQPLRANHEAFVQAASQVEAGRYLITVAGCNDCHTAGYLMTMGNVPEAQWLLGDSVGWRGPWGTTYPSNLRIFASEFEDDETWVQVLKARNTRPPMPWMNLHDMSERDLKAIWHYLRHLGPAGEKMPEFVPPDQEPTTPYLLLVPQMPAGVEGG